MSGSDRTLTRRTSLRAFAGGVDWTSFRTAVSLHAHTFHSREVLSDLPSYVNRIPLLGARLKQELGERRARRMDVDFTRAAALRLVDDPASVSPIPAAFC